MIRQIAPQFFITDLPATLAYYKDKLGFDCLGTWQDRLRRCSGLTATLCS